MLNSKWLPMAALIACSIPVAAQPAPEPAPGAADAPQTPAPRPEVEGATPDRVAQVERCQGHKFDTMVEIDPVRKRSTRVKLCANPGSTDAQWVNTLEAAIVQIEQRAMPEEAKDKVIGELRAEIAKFATVARSAPTTPGGTIDLGGFRRDELIAPAERYETSIVPPLPAPLPRRVAGTGTTSSAGTATPAPPPRPAMRFRIKCLARGESGPGGTCDFFEPSTVIALSAVAGLEKGGTLRFRRLGEERGTVALPPLAPGKSLHVRLPSSLCRGVAFTKVELELLAPGSAGAVADRAGPFGMRC